jgi:hypothetical protein
MTADNDLERRLADFYATEAPPRAPDWVLGAVLDTVDTTPQRRVRMPVPWRFPTMNTYAKWAIAAVVVVAVGAIGLAALRPGPSSGVGAQASPSPSLSPSPSPSPSPDTPALTGSFTSRLHGFSIAYPTGWITAPATQPVTDPGLSFQSPDMDWIYDGQYNADLFLGLGSQSLGDKSPETWVSDFFGSFDGGCDGPRVPIAVDGADGFICGANLFATAVGGRGYFVRSYTGDGIPPELQRSYDELWLRSVLATMQLRPEAAVGASPSTSASAS